MVAGFVEANWKILNRSVSLGGWLLLISGYVMVSQIGWGTFQTSWLGTALMLIFLSIALDALIGEKIEKQYFKALANHESVERFEVRFLYWSSLKAGIFSMILILMIAKP